MSQNTFHVASSVKDLPSAIEQYKKILGIEYRQRVLEADMNNWRSNERLQEQSGTHP